MYIYDPYFYNLLKVFFIKAIVLSYCFSVCPTMKRVPFFQLVHLIHLYKEIRLKTKTYDIIIALRQYIGFFNPNTGLKTFGKRNFRFISDVRNYAYEFYCYCPLLLSRLFICYLLHTMLPSIAYYLIYTYYSSVVTIAHILTSFSQ